MSVDFSSYDAVLLDLDGTIYHDNHALPGAMELLHRLRDDGRLFACLSNTTTSPQRIATRLAQMGLDDLDPDHIYTAAYAAVIHVLEAFGPHPRIYNLASKGVQEMLKGQAHLVQSADEPCDAVIVGAITNSYATEARLRTALALLRQGAQLVGTSADRVFPSPRGLEFGSGALSALLAYAADVQPFFCGKPQTVFFTTLCRRLGVDPTRCVLIGDNLETDVLGARQVGMKTILTLTGVAQPHDLTHLPTELQPHQVVPDLTHL